jgi:hypothetical protein
MTALISAELLRLRTVRAPRYMMPTYLAMVAIITASNAGTPSSAGAVKDLVRTGALLGVVMAASYVAYNVADEFKRGSAAMTYLVHPLRERVAAAQAITYAAVSFVFAGVTAAVVLGIVLRFADADHVNAGFSAADLALTVGGAAFAGAVLGAAGALIGTVARHPTIAVSAVMVWYVAETMLTRGGTRGGIWDYLPFELVGSAMGLTDTVPVLAAMGLLLVYLAALALAVRKWALPRDLT